MEIRNSIFLVIALTYCPLTTTAQKVALKNQIKPQARMYHSLRYHNETKDFLLFAGHSKHGWRADLRDIWKYDPDTNTWMAVGICEPVAEDSTSYFTAIAYDIESDRFITIDLDGNTWSYHYESNTWQNMYPEQSPQPRCGQGMVYDEASDRVIMFGGFGCRSVNDAIFGDTWAYDYNSNSWVNLKPAVSPSARMYFAMSYDKSRKKVMLWGGRKYEPITDNNMWAYDFDANNWTSLVNIDGPNKSLAYSSMVYRNATKDLLLFGGGELESVFKGEATNSTWSYSPEKNKWIQLFPKSSPPRLANHSMAYDPIREEVVLFGGEFGALYSDKVSAEVWVFVSEEGCWINR